MAILSLLASLVMEFVRSEPFDPLTRSICNFSKQNPYITLQASDESWQTYLLKCNIVIKHHILSFNLQRKFTAATGGIERLNGESTAANCPWKASLSHPHCLCKQRTIFLWNEHYSRKNCYLEKWLWPFLLLVFSNISFMHFPKMFTINLPHKVRFRG